MGAAIPSQFLDLFQKKAFGNLATLMPDGSPQVTPIWVDYDGKHVMLNSARGRRKDKNMKAGASVAVAIGLKYPSLVRGLVLASGYYYPTARPFGPADCSRGARTRQATVL